MYAKAIQFERYCKLTILACITLMFICATLYGFFLMQAVGSTAVRTHAETNIAEINSETGALQSRYLLAMQSITPERAAALGFTKPQAAAISYLNTSAQNLSLNIVR